MKHNIRPGIPGFLTDIIDGRETRPDYPRIPWVSSYQGEMDFEYRGRRLRFRNAKVTWSLGYWNYENEEAFNREHNGNWGMVTRGTEPLDAQTLEIFRQEHFPTAVTGFYDHLSHSWVQCEPTKEELSMGSWLRYKLTREYKDKWADHLEAGTQRTCELSLMAE